MLAVGMATASKSNTGTQEREVNTGLSGVGSVG